MLAVIVFHLACCSTNIISAHVCRARSKGLLKEPFYCLPDLGHELLPRLPHYMPDFLLVPLMVLTVLTCLVHLRTDENAVLLVTNGLLFAGRGFCSVLTTMPTCMPDTDSPEWKQKGELLKLYDFFLHSPYDLMYSGHTSIFLTCALAWHRYIPITSVYLQIGQLLSRIAMVLGPITLVAARQHYSVDVVIALIICGLLFSTTIPNTIATLLL